MNMDDESFASLYDDRYSKVEWRDGDPAVFVRELDLSVRSDRSDMKIELPSKNHSYSVPPKYHISDLPNPVTRVEV